MNKSIQILAATLSGKHEAPLVVGHLKHDDPAFGWAETNQLASSSTTVGIGSARIGWHRLTYKIKLLAIFNDIVCFYNRNRIHQSLGYRTPDEVGRLDYGA